MKSSQHECTNTHMELWITAKKMSASFREESSGKSSKMKKKTYSNNFNNFSSRKYRNLVLRAKFKLVGTLRCSYCFDTLHVHQKSKLASSNTNHNIHCNYEYETQKQTVDQISKHQDRYNKFSQNSIEIRVNNVCISFHFTDIYRS